MTGQNCGERPRRLEQALFRRHPADDQRRPFARRLRPPRRGVEAVGDDAPRDRHAGPIALEFGEHGLADEGQPGEGVHLRAAPPMRGVGQPTGAARDAQEIVLLQDDRRADARPQRRGRRQVLLHHHRRRVERFDQRGDAARPPSRLSEGESRQRVDRCGRQRPIVRLGHHLDAKAAVLGHLADIEVDRRRRRAGVAHAARQDLQNSPSRSFVASAQLSSPRMVRVRRTTHSSESRRSVSLT